jgi:hypothetical protein
MLRRRRNEARQETAPESADAVAPQYQRAQGPLPRVRSEGVSRGLFGGYGMLTRSYVRRKWACIVTAVILPISPPLVGAAP